MTTKLIAASAYQASAVGKNHSNLLELIDAYAEARHAGGCHTYNTKTAEARANVAASLAANAGSEPVAIYHGRCVIDCGAHGHLDMELLKMIPAGSKLYTHPSPPEGMVGGWMPIETAPKDGAEILGYTAEAGNLVLYWDNIGREPAHWSDGMSIYNREPTHWQPLPAAPSISGETK